MPDNKDIVRLQHMLEAAKKATKFVEGHAQGVLKTDEKLMLALIRLLEIIGEAAKGVSPVLQKRHPKIAWKEITGTRDRLIHGYFDVDPNIVWQIITKDLPVLITQLEKIIRVSEDPS